MAGFSSTRQNSDITVEILWAKFGEVHLVQICVKRRGLNTDLDFPSENHPIYLCFVSNVVVCDMLESILCMSVLLCGMLLCVRLARRSTSLPWQWPDSGGGGGSDLG